MPPHTVVFLKWSILNRVQGSCSHVAFISSITINLSLRSSNLLGGYQ